MQKLRIEKKLKVRLMEIAIVIISYRPRVTDVIGQVSTGNSRIGIWEY